MSIKMRFEYSSQRGLSKIWAENGKYSEGEGAKGRQRGERERLNA